MIKIVGPNFNKILQYVKIYTYALLVVILEQFIEIIDNAIYYGNNVALGYRTLD